MNKPCVSHMDESWHTQMSHGTHKWILALVNESTYGWVMAFPSPLPTGSSRDTQTPTHPVRVSWLINSHSHIWLINSHSHIWMNHVEYKWVMSHKNESCHIWMSHVTYEWVMSHVNEACHIWMNYVAYKLVMSHMNVSWHLYCLCQREAPETPTHPCSRALDSSLPESESWHMYVNRVTHMWMGRVTHPCSRALDSSLPESESCHTYMNHVTHTWMSLVMHPCLTVFDMGWLRLVGSLKLYVSFAKEP